MKKEAALNWPPGVPIAYAHARPSGTDVAYLLCTRPSAYPLCTRSPVGTSGACLLMHALVSLVLT